MRNSKHHYEPLGPDQLSRPVITQYEGQLLNNLSHAVKSAESKFWCGGSAILGVEALVLLYSAKSPDGGKAAWKQVDLGMSVEGFAKLHEAATPSSHGVGSRTVYDESYRLARELRVGQFALNFDPIGHGTGIVDAVAAVCGSDIRVQLYKMNSYAEGGFFGAHKDTPKSEDHIGSIVVALPAPYEGGELVIHHADRMVTFDWGRSMDSRSLQWAFFFSDITHEILPVKKGHRITLAYDVYRADETTPSTLAINPQSTPLFEVFSRTLADPDFLPDGGRVAFSLHHEYPVENNSSADQYLPLLKGSDRLLYELLASLKLEANLLAVYELEPSDVLGWEREEELQGVGPPDEFTSWFSHQRNRYTENAVLLVSNKFRGITCDIGYENNTVYDELLSRSNAGVDNGLIWCSRPADTWTLLSNYITYGNEASVAYSYAAAALVVTIPVPSQR